MTLLVGGSCASVRHAEGNAARGVARRSDRPRLTGIGESPAAARTAEEMRVAAVGEDAAGRRRIALRARATSHSVPAEKCSGCSSVHGWPRPMWFGTKSSISLSPRSASRDRAKAASPPSRSGTA